MNGPGNKHSDLAGTADNATPSPYTYISWVIPSHLWHTKNNCRIKLKLELDHWIVITQTQLIFKNIKCFIYHKELQNLYSCSKNQSNFYRQDHPLFNRLPCIFSQPLQSQRSAVGREKACPAHCGPWFPVGLVVHKRENWKSYPRSEHGERSGTLLKTAVEIKRNCFSRQVYVSQLQWNLGEAVTHIFILQHLIWWV